MNIDKQDYKFMEQNPEGDLGFSEEHNRKVIADTILKTNRNRRVRHREFEESLKERTWAVSKFLRNVDKGGEEDPIKFFGKDQAMYLKGKEIIDRLAESLNATKLEEHSKKTA